MTDDPQNQGPLLASLGARRIGVDHYTEHDFEMERVGRKQSEAVYAKRLKTLEAAGWAPFRGPFYYGNREWHGGHHPPDTKKRVPTQVAFAMFKEANPNVELEPYPPHPHGWTRPTSSAGLFKNEIVSVEPMKVPAGSFFTMKMPETEHDREQKRWKEFCSQFEGVRSTGIGSRADENGKAIPTVFVTLEDNYEANKVPTEWEGKSIYVKVKPEAEERAEKESKNKAAQERHNEETAWIRKARIT